MIGGSDVSGNKIDGGEVNYISLLIGREDVINTVYNKIGINGIHMKRLTKSQRKRVENSLDFSFKDVRVWCIHVRKHDIEKHILNHPKLKKYAQPKKIIHKNFDKHLFNLIKKDLEEFVNPYKYEIQEISVQTDDDMKYTIKIFGMNHKIRGRAYELADVVAWFNQKRIKIKHCIELELVEQIKSRMESDLLK